MPTIVVLATGGTIAGRAQQSADHVNYQAGTVGVDAMLAEVLGPPSAQSQAAASLFGHTVRAEQVAQVDSKDMDWPVWHALWQRCHVALADPSTAGVVITHGTDTLEETAYLLQRVLQPRKPVVLVSAMRPASALSADGPQNLLDALLIAAQGAAAGMHGVLAVAAGTVHAAQDVMKVHPYRLDAFSSGDSGPLAYVEQQALRVVRPLTPVGGTSEALPTQQNWAQVAAQQPPWVGAVYSAGAVRAADVDIWVDAGVQGLVVVGTGNATVNEALWPGLERAHRKGIAMRRTTRCLQGPAVPAGAQAPKAGGLDLWCPLAPLTPPKLRVALQLHLGLGLALP